MPAQRGRVAFMVGWPLLADLSTNTRAGVPMLRLLNIRYRLKQQPHEGRPCELSAPWVDTRLQMGVGFSKNARFLESGGNGPFRMVSLMFPSPVLNPRLNSLSETSPSWESLTEFVALQPGYKDHGMSISRCLAG